MEEKEYENKIRTKWMTHAKIQNRLPIIKTTGEIKYDDDNENSSEIKREKRFLEEIDRIQKKTQKKAKKLDKKEIFTKDLVTNEKQGVDQFCVWLISHIEDILATPSINLFKLECMTNTINNLKFNQNKLFLFGSCGILYRDLLPSYSMKHLDAKINSQMKKTTIKIRDYEKTFLEIYKNFLIILKEKFKIWPEISSKIATELMTASPMFKFHEQKLLPLLIRYSCYQKLNHNISDVCITCLKNIIEKDVSQDISRRIIDYLGRWFRLAHINRLLNDKTFTLNPKLLFIFLDIIDLQKRKETKQFLNIEIEDENYRDIKKSQVNPHINHVLKNEENNLKQIFIILLRILKNARIYSKLEILNPIFEILAKLSLRVNVELTIEIYYEIKKICENHLEKDFDPKREFEIDKLDLIEEMKFNELKIKLNPLSLILGLKCVMTILAREGFLLNVEIVWIFETLFLLSYESLTLQNKKKFQIHIQELFNVLINCPLIGGDNESLHTIGKNINLAKLIYNFINASVHSSCYQNQLFDIFLRIFENFPRLLCLLDENGFVISSLDQPISLFYQIQLLSCHYDNRFNHKLQKKTQKIEKKGQVLEELTQEIQILADI